MPALLKITPERVIEFPVTLYAPSSVEVILENHTQPFVAFKIKTTAPKSYLVRPSTGIIAQGQKQVIQIVLQPFTEEPRGCTDRFLVQSTAVASNEPLPRDYWQSLNKDSVVDSRLSVVFKSVSNTANATKDLQAEPSLAVPESPRGNSDWKTQYDRLVEYALAMERHKDELLQETERLKKQLESQKQSRMFEVWHIPIYIFFCLMLWFVYGQSSSSGRQYQQ